MTTADKGQAVKTATVSRGGGGKGGKSWENKENLGKIREIALKRIGKKKGKDPPEKEGGMPCV